MGVLASGVELARRRQRGLGIYALVLAAAFAWTVGEVGLDKWQWIPRGALLLLVGFVLCLPPWCGACATRRSGPGSLASGTARSPSGSSCC